MTAALRATFATAVRMIDWIHRRTADVRPNALPPIATRLAEQKISIESIVQRHPNGAGAAENATRVPVILITYATHEDAVHRALQAVQRDKVISGRPQVIRIEKN